MKVANKKKKKVIAFCLEQLQNAERTAERQSIAKIDEYRKKEKHIYRAIETKRRLDNDGPLPNYDNDEKDLLDSIEMLNGELMDIEIKLQNALKISTGQFTTQVGAIITDMKSFSEELFKDVAEEVAAFYEKLKEQCNAEKDSLVTRLENNEDIEQVMADYPEGDPQEFVVEVVAGDDKELLSDTLNHFKEQID